MRRTITIAAGAIGIAGALAGVLVVASTNCGPWSLFGCHGADPELTRLIR